MGAKSNFNQAAYELFGIGSNQNQEQPDNNVEEKNNSLERVSVERAVPVQSSYIAPGSIFEGCLRTKGNVEVAGEFKGDIYSEARVVLHTNMNGNVSANELELIDCKLTGDLKINNRFIVGEKSSVKGKVVAQAMECAGVIEGDVFIERELTLKSCAEVTGNIHTVSMSMEHGAKVHGNIDMGPSVNSDNKKKGNDTPCE